MATYYFVRWMKYHDLYIKTLLEIRWFLLLIIIKNAVYNLYQR